MEEKRDNYMPQVKILRPELGKN